MAYQENVDNIKDSATQTVNDASDGAAKAADRLQKDGDAVKRDISQRAQAFSEEVSDTIERVRDDVKDVQVALVDAGRAVARDFASRVRERPLAAIFAAAAAGYVFGLTRRR